MPEIPAGTSAWCAGLRLSREYPLSDAERREIRRRALLNGILGFLALGSSPFLFVFFLISLSLNADPHGTPG
ncbi:MAG TPA: hypothetical protein VFU47_15235, partial [Armatimonadota bacterium]|nr:hypothetical protein [Armatimonadota bacterium]